MQQQPGTLTLNRQQFQRMAYGLKPFGQLETVLGAERSEEVVRLLYERRVLETNPNGRYILLTGDSMRPERTALAHTLEMECTQIASKRTYVGALLGDALEGRLRRQLGSDEALDLPFSRDADIRKAADWISRTLHGGRESLVREILAEHAVAPKGEEVLGKTPEVLDRLHGRLFPEVRPARGPNPQTAYPSSVGGRTLLEEVFQQTAGAVWPLPGNIWWLNVALFFMAAIGTVQGFADGNKRAARLAYAVILLRARRAFVAPSADLEADLFRMHGGPGS